VSGAGAFDNFNCFEDIALGFGDDFPHFGREQDREFVKMLVQQRLEPEHQLNALGNRGV